MVYYSYAQQVSKSKSMDKVLKDAAKVAAFVFNEKNGEILKLVNNNPTTNANDK